MSNILTEELGSSMPKRMRLLFRMVRGILLQLTMGIVCIPSRPLPASQEGTNIESTWIMWTWKRKLSFISGFMHVPTYSAQRQGKLCKQPVAGLYKVSYLF